MKMKFSNKEMLDSLSKNYSVMQNNKFNKNVCAALSGVAGGFIVALIMNYFQKKEIDGFVATIKQQRIQNDQLQLENHVLKEKNKIDFLVNSEKQSDNTITESDVSLINKNNDKLDDKI